MGMTGADGFPCCSKDSVDIVETQIDLNQHELQPAHEELQPTQEEPQPAQEEPQPAQEEPQPAQEEPQPAQELQQPAQEEPQPAQEEPQPAQEEPQPAQEEPQPAQEEPQPAQEEPQPAQEEPQPAQEEPQPAQEEPQPAQEEPQPAQEEPQPAQEEPQPAQEEPQPAQEEPQPAQEEPQPAQEEPQPAQEEPQPAQEEPQPAQEEPQPAQEEPQPAQEEPQPAQEEPQPAQEEPQPAQEEPQPAQEELQPAQEEPQPAQEEDEEKVDELLHLNVPPKENLEQDTKPVQEAKVVPLLEYCPPLEFCPASMLKPEGKQDSSLKVFNEDLESSQPLEGALTQQDTQQWNVRSSSITSPSITDEEQVDSTHRSIFVQTSKHLFWADKDIQASEYSLDLETGMQRGESTEKIASPPIQKAAPEPVPVKQFQDESTQAELPEPGTRQPSDTHLPSPYLTPEINLQDLVNFASSLAIASSSNRDLPSLEHMIKSPPQKAAEPSTVPMVESTTPPAKEEPEQEKLPEVQERASEKSPEAGEPLESAKQEDKTLHPYFDFSKPEPQRTAFKGKVKFIRAPARSSSLNGDRKDSVPGTKKETPLMLKIHFKLLPTSSPREMTKQNQ
ncbi:PREDICTED: spermatogenesis-associated protein 32 isoform X2 [Myotis brandtii]|uniref:spermatogenesis-associated protein 32 isoform X2 n=1 Tax=Myotis brandtii TaxID=109478 RepID=UPI0003BBFE8F|nr:PREDICTED: spermatogenesis-associated protein 32 isoform X2 [Myotis brandtii]